MPGWLKTILLRTLAPLVRVKVKRRRLSVKESLRSTDGGHALDTIHNPTFETFNHSDNGLALTWVGDVFEQNSSVSVMSVNLRKDSVVDEEMDSKQNINNCGKNCNGIAGKGNHSIKLKEKLGQEKENTHEIMEPTLHQIIEWQDEWRAASQVLDRLIIISSVIIGCVSAAVIFLQAPRVRQMLSFS